MNEEIKQAKEVVDIAAIGRDDSILLFNAVGIKTFFTTDVTMIDKIIYNLVKSECKIIYIDEKLYQMIPETLSKYAHQPYPIILPLPLNGIKTGEGLQRIQKNVEKAIGINIF